MGAKILGQPKKMSDRFRSGKKADLIIVGENPVANLKVLYATGHIKLDAAGKPVRSGGIETVIKDGIVYDAKALAADVRAHGRRRKRKRGHCARPHADC